MTSFEDGPAKGQALMLRRAPLYLRAVQGPKGDWDALDQLTDEPSADERVVVYRREGDAGWCHVRARNGGGFYALGRYRQVDPPPADDEVRDVFRWRRWVSEQVGAPVTAEGVIEAPR